MRKSILERFFRYVRIDTQSREDAGDVYPSTENQKVLGRMLVEELKALGLKDAEMDEHGYVTATCPSNLPSIEEKKVPVIGFIGHMDTSPEVSGKDVKPVLHRNYRGGDIVLPGDKSQILRQDQNPELLKYIGDDIVTSDGTTLLGADNKAGLAEILTMIEVLNRDTEIKHGKIRIGFTPDEEVGAGTKYFDVKRFGADYAYTVDGERAGEVENETFNAALAVFTINGVNMHPGYAKGKMVNAIRVASGIIGSLEGDPAPENTEKRGGYLHPYQIEGGVEKAVIKVLLRDFEKEGMREKEKRLKQIAKENGKSHPGARILLDIQHQYENMRFKLEEFPDVVEYALEAVRRTGLEPQLQIIRGGTDGARLCFKGLLTPNLFTGGMNFHSKLEWVAVSAMEKAVATLVNLVQVWTEKSL